MANLYYIDPTWVERNYYAHRNRRPIYGLVTAGLLVITWFTNIYVFWAAIVGAIAFWISEFAGQSIGKIKQMSDEHYLEVRPEGLRHFCRGTKGEPISLIHPWDQLEIREVKRKNGSIQSIRLRDNSLPWHVAKLEFVGFERMECLLSDIESSMVQNDT